MIDAYSLQTSSTTTTTNRRQQQPKTTTTRDNNKLRQQQPKTTTTRKKNNKNNNSCNRRSLTGNRFGFNYVLAIRWTTAGAGATVAPKWGKEEGGWRVLQCQKHIDWHSHCGQLPDELPFPALLKLMPSSAWGQRSFPTWKMCNWANPMANSGIFWAYLVSWFDYFGAMPARAHTLHCAERVWWLQLKWDELLKTELSCQRSCWITVKHARLPLWPLIGYLHSLDIHRDSHECLSEFTWLSKRPWQRTHFSNSIFDWLCGNF